MKRILRFFLILTLLSVFTLCAAAEDNLAAQKEIWLSDDQYYYQQLSPEHKAAWETDVANALTYPVQTDAASVDLRYQALASMIKTDNPRIFWIDWIDALGRLRYDTGSTATYAAMAFPEGTTLETHKELFLAAIDTAVAEIQASLPANAGVYDKAKAIHDWLCVNNTYNSAQTSSHKKDHDPVSFAYQAAHSAYSAIVKGDEYQPVCEGYASAFKILCEELGVPCVSVHGSTTFASGHMWNCVQTEDGKWYIVDVTGDDVDTSGIDYYHYYFMIGSDKVANQGYIPQPYMNSGVNPSNGYTEGAAFTTPETVK